MLDRYTKAVLTVIAASLIALVVQNSVTSAVAVGATCGESRQQRCYIEIVRVRGEVEVDVDGSVEIDGTVNTRN